MRWKERIRRINETLLDLIIGCLVHFIIFEIIGLLVIPDKLAWTAGLLLGTLTAIAMSVTMQMGIKSCLSMEPAAARRAMTLQSVIRILLVLVIAWLGLRFHWLSFPGILVGILGLKLSAHFHMYIHVHITKKLLK